MTPIYFPFTWADAPTIQAITAVFPGIAMYQPLEGRAPAGLRSFEQAGNLEIRVPVTADSRKLEMLVADYRSWARLHQGSDLALLNSRQPASPFTDTLSSRIQSDILQYQDAVAEPAPDPVFSARLFLEIAASYDAQQAELTGDLEKIQHLEKRFMAALGDNAEMEAPVPIGNQSLFPEAPGGFMLAERLQAWSTLFLQDSPQRTADGPWVTTHLPVLEWIQDEIAMAPVLEINCIPIPKTIDDGTRYWQESLMAYMSRLQAAPWPSAVQTFEPPSSDYAWENAVSVKGFLIPDMTPSAFFHKLAAGPDSPPAMPAFSPEPARHTILIYINTL